MLGHDDLLRIITSHESKVRGFFSRKVFEVEDVEDLVQDTFCAVLESYRRFSGRSSVTTWIYAICRNVLYSYYHHKTRSRNLIRRLQHPTEEESEENLLYLRWASDTLAPKHKKLFNDFYRDAMPIKAIALRSGVPEGTVKYQLYELRKELKRIFDRN